MSYSAAFFRQQLSFTSHANFPINTDTDIDVYLFNSNTIDSELLAELAARYLHPREHAIFNKRKQLQAKQEYLASRFIIKTYASHSLGYDFESLYVLFDDKDTCLKVYHQNETVPLYCCISHSHGQVLVACALASLNTRVTKDTSAENTINIGIDLEWISTKRTLDRVATHYYHNAELNACIAQATLDSDGIEKLDKTLHSKALYRVWTLKEALAKAIRQPIAKLLRDNVFALCQPWYVQSGIYEYNERVFDVSIISNIKGTDNSGVDIKVLTQLLT